MNPRHRRLLIPGLLIALLVVVIVSSLLDRADGAEDRPEVVSRITDSRVVESSGLAVSVRHGDLAYTINDSGNAPIVFAVRISTGEVVGATTLSSGLVDAEAIAIDREGRLWVADTGDNRAVRDDVALYALPEPGPGDRTVTPTRYRLAYQDGPADVETLLVNQRTGAKSLVTKGLLGGEVLTLPDELSATRVNEARAGDSVVPGMVTDGALTTDGRHAILRTYGRVYVYDARTWELLRSQGAPAQPQGESIAIERAGRSILLGSEGADSALIRMPLTLPPGPADVPSTTEAPATPQDEAAARDGNGFAGSTWLWAGGVVALLATIAVAASRRG